MVLAEPHFSLGGHARFRGRRGRDLSKCRIYGVLMKAIMILNEVGKPPGRFRCGRTLANCDRGDSVRSHDRPAAVPNPHLVA